MRKLIAFTGPPGSGKDECATAMCQMGWYRLAFADPVRTGLLALNPLIPYMLGHSRLRYVVGEIGWEAAKKIPEVRELLQRYGTEAGRDIHGHECWISLAEDKLFDMPRSACVAITDLRLDNEWQMVKRYQGIVAYVERPGYEAVNNHSSEKQYAKFRAMADVIIYNDAGISNLVRQLVSIAE